MRRKAPTMPPSNKKSTNYKSYRARSGISSTLNSDRAPSRILQKVRSVGDLVKSSRASSRRKVRDTMEMGGD